MKANEMNSLSQDALNQLFLEARTINDFLPTPISQEVLNQLYDIAKMGPTAANCNPARFYFIKSLDAKERLKPYLAPGNVDKSMKAPIVVIAAFDPKFYDKVPKLFPHAPDARDWFAKSPDEGLAAGHMNATLGAAYFIMAARALGLECGPMAGFDNAGVDKEFFGENGWKSNFLINLGNRSDAPIFPRLPRLEFNEACEIA